MVKDETGIIANQWLKFLRDQYNLKLVDNNHINLITPITDSFDDSITLMISKKDGLYTVSDQGYTIWNLETKNINVTKKKSRRNLILKSILEKEHVQLSPQNAIYKIGIQSEISQMIFNVIQAVSKIGNMGLLTTANVKSLFSDDVDSYFKQNDDKFKVLRGFDLRGKSDLVYTIDYIFNPTITNDVTKVYDSLSKSIVEQLIGIWLDSEIVRKKNNNNMTFNIIVPSLQEEKQLSLARNLGFHEIKVIPFDDKKILQNTLGSVA